MSAQVQSGRQQERDSFYFWMAVLMLACTIIGFGYSLGSGKWNSQAPTPVYLILHGIFQLAWFVWFLLQTSLVRRGNFAMHRRTGVAGVLIGVLALITMPFVFLNVPARILAHGVTLESDMSSIPIQGIEGMQVGDFLIEIVLGGFAQMAAFALLLGLAVAQRKRPDWHKRLMLFASLSVIGPAFARLSRIPGFGGEDSPFLPMTLLALLLAPLIHDVVKERRIHKASWLGIASVIGLQIAFRLLAATPLGEQLVPSLL